MASSFQDDGDRDSRVDPRAQERVGTVLDEKWTLERILGIGGMGVVYAGRHRNGARGAVKVLHPEYARRADVRERFLREGYAANRVGHRGAVQVLDDDTIKEGPDEGTAYLVMELLDGESLEDRMEKGAPIGEAELLRILDDVLAVLESAHVNGVIHRDLKPANLWLNADPAGHPVKVLDFGLARLDEATAVTRAGIPLGTPSFMAPEQALGEKDQIDGRTDLFALGATAFMILSNRGVHEAEGVIELVARMGTMPAPKLREVAPLVGEPIARIVDRALEFERESRYPDAAAMRADIALARGESEQTSAAVTLVGAPSVPPPSATRTTVPPDESRPGAVSVPPPSTSPSSMAPALPSRRGSRLLVGLGIVGLIGAGAALVVVPRIDRARALAALMSGAPDASESPAPVNIEPVVVASTPTDTLDAAADAGDGGDAGDDEEDDDDDDDAGAPAAGPLPAVAKPLASSHPVAVAKHVPGKPAPAKAKTNGKKKKKKKK